MSMGKRSEGRDELFRRTNVWSAIVFLIYRGFVNECLGREKTDPSSCVCGTRSVRACAAYLLALCDAGIACVDSTIGTAVGDLRWGRALGPHLTREEKLMAVRKRDDHLGGIVLTGRGSVGEALDECRNLRVFLVASGELVIVLCRGY
jgi:hypothetical protein